MPTNTFFSINGDDLNRLTSAEAVDALAALIRLEAWRLQIPYGNVDVPRAITVTDGGIDAEVENPTGQGVDFHSRLSHW